MYPMNSVVLITELVAPYRIPVLNELARLLEGRLHVVFMSDTDTTMRQWQVYKEEISFSYEILPFWRRRMGRFHVLLNWGMWRCLRRNSPQAIICGGYNYLATWTALLWARAHGRRFVLWTESTAREQRGSHYLPELAKHCFIRGCDGFAAAGKSQVDYLVQLGAPPSAVITAPDAVDTDLFAKRAAEAKADATQRRQQIGVPDKYFLFAGRLIELKGVFDLLAAYSQLDEGLRREFGLVFVGHGVAREQLIARAASLRPGDVRVIDFRNRDELAAYYALATAFVFPTHSDPWGLVINEAMACGLPVVVSDAAGCAAELVRDGWNGFVVRVGDMEGIARVMTRIVVEDLGETMGRRSIERIQYYSPTACAAGLAAAAEGGVGAKQWTST